MTEIVTWWNETVLPPTVLPVALVCAICGALVLSFFTRWLGYGTLIFNTAALFMGAYLANLLTHGLRIPLERFYERPVVVSFMGMAAAALLVLLGFVRNNRNP